MTEGGLNAILNTVERTFKQDKNFRRLNSKLYNEIRIVLKIVMLGGHFAVGSGCRWKIDTENRQNTTVNDRR